MGEAVLAALREVPLAPLLVGAALIALTAQLVLLRAALKQRKRELAATEAAAQGRWSEVTELDPGRTKRLELAAALTPILLVGAAAVSTGRARGILGRLAANEDPAEKAALISQLIGGQLNALAFGASSLILVSTLAVIALSIAVATRLRLSGLRRAAELAQRGQGEGGSVAVAAALAQAPGPRLALVYASASLFHGMGLLPLLVGALNYCTTLIQTFAGMVGQPPEQKIVAFDRALVVARITLDASYRSSQLGLLIATIAVGVLWSIRRRTGAPPPPPRKVPALVAFALLGAAGLYAAARPLRAENAVPWPPMDSSGDISFLRVSTPRLRGPDPVPRAPVVLVTPEVTQLDGREVNLTELGEKLRTLANNYGLLRPGYFKGEGLVVCSAETAVSRVRERLYEGFLVGYEHPVFVFIERTQLHRPMLGELEHVTNTGARVAAVDLDDDGLGLHGSAEPVPGTVRLDLATFRTCGDLATRIVEERQQGREVELDVHPPASGAKTP